MRRLSFILLLALSLSTVAANKEQAVLYRSIDQHGDSITLSGLLSYPLDKTPKGVVLIPHYTIASKYQAPSIKPTGEAAYFKEDYILLMPDLIGYGVTVDMPHPYLAGELTAHNCADMLSILHPMLDSLQFACSLDSVYIVGYSQGGASAVWTMKVMEEEYADRYHVIACYAGGGPYDVAVTYDDALAKKKVFMPAVVPMLVVGTDAAYDLRLNYSDYFTPKMQKIYDECLAGKEYSTSQLFFKFLDHRLKTWMSPMALDPARPEMKSLYEGFKRSSLVRYPLNDKIADQQVICPSWIPKAPLYVFHSTKDNVVTSLCAEHLRRCLPDQPNIIFDIRNYGSHVRASARFFPKVVEMMSNGER